MIAMEAKDVLLKLRTEHGLSQDALAEKLFVTRQAVSRWERGDTLPNTETLKLLSKLYDVSINTLLGSPRTLICQCCGMPLDDTTISREPGGAFNEDYCKWCYTDAPPTASANTPAESSRGKPRFFCSLIPCSAGSCLTEVYRRLCTHD